MLRIGPRRAVLLGSKAFSPLDLTLGAWHRIDILTGLSDGDPVALCPDASGNGHDATQSIAASKPLYKINIANGLPGLLFDRVDDALEMAFDATAHDWTISAVINLTQANAGYFVVIPSGIIPAAFSDGMIGRDLSYFVSGWKTFTQQTVGLQILTWVLSETNGGVIYKNGQSQGAAQAYSKIILDVVSYGAAVGTSFAGYLLEAVICPVAITETERNRLENYYAAKFGITLG